MTVEGFDIKAVYCDSGDCIRSGNSLKEIKVWYTQGQRNQQDLDCPFCGARLTRTFENSGEIRKIVADKANVWLRVSSESRR